VLIGVFAWLKDRNDPVRSSISGRTRWPVKCFVAGPDEQACRRDRKILPL
jgi:hypothetical protein